MPTVAGLWWIGTLLILFLIGWGYGNNLCLALAMLVMATTLIFLLEAHFNLEALKLTGLQIEDQFAGSRTTFRLGWRSRKKSVRRHIRVDWDGMTKSESWATGLWQGLEGEVQGVMLFHERGHHRAQHVRLTSVYPLGLFQAWCYHPLECEAWIYPSLRAERGLWDGEDADAENAPLQGKGAGEEPVDFRVYSPGDPMGRVAWKVLARGLPPHTKLFESPQTQRRTYRWPWGTGSELDRGMLAQAIQTSCEQNESWSLETPEGSLPQGDDPLHRRTGLRMLTEAR